VLVVDREVHGADLVGGEGAAVLDGAGRGAVAAAGASSSSSAASEEYCLLSRVRKYTITGTKITITQAPCMNLVPRMIASTTPDSTAPVPLMKKPTFQPFSFLVRWCLAMPDWLMVKLVNTPTA
jgi:hypothetical protein